MIVFSFFLLDYIKYMYHIIVFIFYIVLKLSLHKKKKKKLIIPTSDQSIQIQIIIQTL